MILSSTHDPRSHCIYKLYSAISNSIGNIIIFISGNNSYFRRRILRTLQSGSKCELTRCVWVFVFPQHWVFVPIYGDWYEMFRSSLPPSSGSKSYNILSQKLNNLDTSIPERPLLWRQQRHTSAARVAKGRKLTLHFWHDYSENEKGGRG